MKQFIQTLLLGCIALFGAVAPHTAGAAPFAAFVMDARTGKEIYSKNADARLHPASLTKMMTLYMAFAAIEQGKVRLDSKVTVSSHAAAQPPSRVGLRPGQKIELRYLIRAAAVKSANDAATAIGEGLGGSEAKFAAQMTATARALGMRNTTFRNANGLTVEGHYSSARDLTTLGRRLFYDFPQYYNIFSRRTADAGDRHGVQHEPPLPRQLPGRGRDQDGLHPRRRLQPDRLGAARQQAHHRDRAGRNLDRDAERDHGAAAGHGFRRRPFTGAGDTARRSRPDR